ncbi:MAG: ATP-binding protein [Gammaproteobacteria bacterium]|nr:ATP-binding protein [Gammaproteobacteria bacterium]
MVSVDERALIETLRALTDNAFAAIHKVKTGKVKISVYEGTSNQFLHSEDVEQTIVVEIADNGTGMDIATLDHAKEPFFTTREVGRRGWSWAQLR